MSLLEVETLSVKVLSSTLLQGVSFVVNPGEVVVLLGPNGAGKTTLLRAVLGLAQGVTGSVRISGQRREEYNQRSLARLIGYVPQRLHLTFPYTVHEFLEMNLYSWQDSVANLEQTRSAIRRAVILSQIEELLHRPLSELSGGELQRVALASAVVQQPKLLLLDEPASSLDPRYARLLHQQIQTVAAAHTLGVLMVSHDINAALRHATRILALKDGELRFDGSPQSLVSEGVLEEIYEVGFERISHGPNTGVFVVPQV